MSHRAAVGIIAFGLLALASCTDEAQQDESERDDSGAVVEGGDIGVFRLQEGDCVQLPGGTDVGTETDEIADLAAVPCAEPHTGEVILVDDEFFADLDEYPGLDAALDQGLVRCVEVLDIYTDTDYESSNFDAFALTPTPDSWSQVDDRGLVCIGLTLDDSFESIVETTGSIRSEG